MASAEYYRFIRFVTGKEPDSLGKDEETIATPQEIGWWKQYQVRRAIHHLRYGEASPVERHLLQKHNIIRSSHPQTRTK